MQLSVALVRANARAMRRRDPDGAETSARGTSQAGTWARQSLVCAAGLSRPDCAFDCNFDVWGDFGGVEADIARDGFAADATVSPPTLTFQ